MGIKIIAYTLLSLMMILPTVSSARLGVGGGIGIGGRGVGVGVGVGVGGGLGAGRFYGDRYDRYDNYDDDGGYYGGYYGNQGYYYNAPGSGPGMSDDSDALYQSYLRDNRY